MTLFDRLFYSGPMLAVFSDQNRLQRMLDFESALASVEAGLGVIPEDASRIISAACNVGNLHLASVSEDAERSGNLAIPLVKQLSQAVRESNVGAARYVHWGATSQDVIDTGFVLQMREALALVEGQLLDLNAELAALAERHAATVMPGRTWLQHAVPITFGWKAAGWLDAVLRHQDRLQQVRSRALTLQLGGAAGTLASLGADSSAVSLKLAETLGLALPDISWHSSRDRFGEVAAFLGLITATLGKIARDISLLMQSEVAEAFESAAEGKGGSSTRPQKRNPVGCAAVLSAAIRVPGLVATLLSSMVQEHERGLGNWQAEWETLPEIFNLCSGALAKMIDVLAGLEVDEFRMASNLELTNGLIFAEGVSMKLGTQLGRAGAHALVERASRLAIENKKHLRDVLMGDAECKRLLSDAEIAALFDPAGYLGMTRQSIGRVLGRAASMDAGSRTSAIEVSGARIHFKLSGPADKPVLVFSNSLGADLSMWNAQAEQLSKYFRILRYDTRGHGRSSASAGPYTIELLGRDLISLLDELGIESCSFCGLSMGGMVGQWLALHAASRVQRIVLSNTAAKIGSAESWNARIATVQNDGFNAIVPGVLDRWFTPAFHLSRPDLIARTRAMLEKTNPAGYTACCAALRDADFREDASQINVPTLVIAGTHDPAAPLADSRLLAGSVSGAQFVELDASHLSNVEAEKRFNAAVLKFLLS